MSRGDESLSGFLHRGSATFGSAFTGSVVVRRASRASRVLFDSSKSVSCSSEVWYCLSIPFEPSSELVCRSCSRRALCSRSVLRCSRAYKGSNKAQEQPEPAGMLVVPGRSVPCGCSLSMLTAAPQSSMIFQSSLMCLRLQCGRPSLRTVPLIFAVLQVVL